MLLAARRSPHTGPRLLARCALACLVALGFGGCALGLVYPRLDTVVGFYLQGLVSLDDAQSAQLKRTLAGNLEWHKRSELARYAAFLRDVAAVVEGGTGRNDWLEASRRTEQYFRKIFEQAAPGYTALAATFTDAQVAELLENLEAADEKTWREFARRTPAERDARREKSMIRAIERFTGPLDAAQRASVRVHVAESPSFMTEWRENRRLWREALAEALAGRRTDPGFEARMFVLIARPDDLWTPQYRAAVEQRRESLARLMATIDATLTPQQRAAARRQLLALADEVQALAGRHG
jgi:hypothetical protein